MNNKKGMIKVTLIIIIIVIIIILIDVISYKKGKK